MTLSEEVRIAVDNRLKSAEASLRSSIIKRDGLLDQVRKTNDSIQDSTKRIQELTAYLSQHSGDDQE